MPLNALSRRCRATLLVLALLPPMLSIAACGQQVGRAILVHRAPPGPDLTDCQTEPPMPEVFDAEADRYAWAAAAIFAGRDCRARLAQLKAWALSPPKG